MSIKTVLFDTGKPKRIGFFRWWLFKDSDDIIYKLLFLYAIITTGLLIILPLFMPIFTWINYNDAYYILLLIHGWLIALVYAIYGLTLDTYKTYKEENK